MTATQPVLPAHAGVSRVLRLLGHQGAVHDQHRVLSGTVCGAEVRATARGGRRCSRPQTAEPHGDRIVAAWAAGDDQELDDAWVDQVIDLGSQWGQYDYVTNIRFAV